MKSIKKVLVNRTEYCNTEGQWHRTNGPAIIWNNGDKQWYVNGKCHRINGPAVELANGTKAWWIDGCPYDEQDYWQAIYIMGLITKTQLMIKLL